MKMMKVANVGSMINVWTILFLVMRPIERDVTSD